MNNAKYLRYAFCAMVLLGMGQQASPVTTLSPEEELKQAEARVERARRLLEQAEEERARIGRGKVSIINELRRMAKEIKENEDEQNLILKKRIQILQKGNQIRKKQKKIAMSSSVYKKLEETLKILDRENRQAVKELDQAYKAELRLTEVYNQARDAEPLIKKATDTVFRLREKYNQAEKKYREARQAYQLGRGMI